MAPRKIIYALLIIVPILAALAGYQYSHATIPCSDAASYSTKPIFIANSATPNIMILFSNDHTNFFAGYGTSSTYNDSIDYYGYFDPRKEYITTNVSGEGAYFKPVGYMTTGHRVTVTGSRWSGNWLNWATMCHADFVRKALTGGKRDLDSASKTILIRGNVPTDGTSGHEWNRTISNAQYYTPYSGTETFRNQGTNIIRTTGGRWDEILVRVEVANATVGVEENAVYYENGKVWKPEGLLQRFRDKANFGLMTYSYDRDDDGGVVRVNVHNIADEINPSGGTIANSDGIIGFINGFQQKGWDPVGEMFYEAVRYFKGLTPTPEFCVNSPDGGFQVICNQGGTKFDWADPISSWCQKNFVIIVNDEYPSRDAELVPGSPWQDTITNPLSIDFKAWTKKVGDLENITGTSRHVGNVFGGTSNNSCSDWKTITNLGAVRGVCPSEGDGQGSFYTAGLAFYAHTNDLRGSTDPLKQQTLMTYAIAFRASPSTYQTPPPPMNQLYLATKYGGFDDLNGNGEPDAGEWEGETDANGVVWPKNFAHAESGKDFENAMMDILNDILRKSASGTAASVVTASEGGEGQLYQAYFEPNRTNAAKQEVTWIGFLHSLWIDAWGNLREDSDSNGKLNLKKDKIVVVRFKESESKTVVDRYSDCNADGTPDSVLDSDCNGTADPDTTGSETVNLPELRPIWEASYQLDKKAPADRKIYTFADKDMNSVVNYATGNEEFIEFKVTPNKDAITPFLQVDATTTDPENVINYIRGTEVTGWRNRVLTEGATSRRFVLGDIVTSSPTPVAGPVDNYDLIYGDKTYLAYYTKYKNRATYVYAGGNDGMLHAFYGGKFHDYGTTTDETAYIEVETGKTLGEEAWAYIPKNVLPHLKWLTCPKYPHVYYVDLKPKILDARIFESEWSDATGTHPYGWGTILVCGMRFGGPNITVRADFDGTGSNPETTQYFKSAYFAIDITDPTAPKLLWEKTYDQMGYTFTYPAIMRLKSGTAPNSEVAFADQKWMIVLGNGPNDFNGDPTGDGHIYIVDLLSGNLARDIQTPSTGSAKEFMASPVVVDLNLDYDADLIYIGSVIKESSGSYSGKMYRVSADGSDADDTHPDFDPSASLDHVADSWIPSRLMDVGKPITAAPGVSQIGEKIWVYFGTGRYIGQQDKISRDLNNFYGLVDVCSFEDGTCAGTLSGTPLITESDLVNVTGINVFETGVVEGFGSGQKTWSELLKAFYLDTISNRGWFLNLEQPTAAPSERVLVKPAIVGGLVLFPSFFPSDDVCAFSGSSRFYSLYYKTGTAWKYSTIGTHATRTTTTPDGKIHKQVLKYVDIGKGLPSQVAIHVGSEAGGKTFTQMSTSSIFELSFTPAMPMQSGMLYWREIPTP